MAYVATSNTKTQMRLVIALGLGCRVFRLVRILHPRAPCATLGVHNPQCVLDTPCHTSDATSGQDFFHPCPLLGANASGRGLYLDAGKHRHLLAHHAWGDGNGAVANKVGAAFAEAKLHRSAVLVAQRAGVIAK